MIRIEFKSRYKIFLAFILVIFVFSVQINQHKLPFIRVRKTLYSPVDFDHEKIYISIAEGTLKVLGDYYLVNNTDNGLILNLYYPFPLDSLHPYPHKIVSATKEYRIRDLGISWQQTLHQPGMNLIVVGYEQALFTSSATYIVTSTKYWLNPIEKAEFFIRVPLDFEEVKFSFEPDSSRIMRNEKLYYITMYDFMPDEDIIVTWE